MILDEGLDSVGLGIDEALAMAGDMCAQLASAHARGRDVDERDDVRAIGMLLANVVSGEATISGAMRLPRELRAVVLRTLHEQRERRYGTVDELARALGVFRPAAQRRARAPGVLAALVTAAVAGGFAYTPPPPAAIVPVAVRPAEARRAIVVSRFGVPSEMLALALAERPHLEVLRRGDAPLRIDGVADGDELHLRLISGETTLWAERLARPSPETMDGVARRLAARLDAGEGPSLLALSSGSAEAWRALVDGGEEGWRRAAALDPTFFEPRLKLAEHDPAQLAAARALVGRAGRRGALLLAVAAARSPAEKVVALEAARAFAPHDLEVAARLAPAYRSLGRPDACAAEAERGGDAVELAWCRAALGDDEGALAAAGGAGDPLVTGDLFLWLGHVAEARRAYATAGAAAAARLALVAARVDGKCPLRPVPVASVEDARAAALVAQWCGDARAAAIEDSLRAAGEPAAAELARLRAAARGDKGLYTALAGELRGWAGDPLERGRRLAPLLAAARVDEQAAAALAGFRVAPVDRHGLFELPLLHEVAMTQIAAGDLEAAGLSCGELDGVLGLYCAGRVAEAAGDIGAAFRAYRELLDRWADASPEHRLLRDATRRLHAVVARAKN